MFYFETQSVNSVNVKRLENLHRFEIEMGCAQSKIDNEESVSRCKERRNLMKEAVVARNAFASAHSGYSVSLKDSGAALIDFAAGEVPPPPLDTAAASSTPATSHGA